MPKSKDKRERKECGTCQGYGMWGFGRYASMGKHDSTTYPTIPCPECGADANPIKNYGKSNEN